MKYTKIAVCPKPLEGWLELINSVPLDEGIFPDWNAFVAAAYYDLTGEDIGSLLLPITELTYEQEQGRTLRQDKALALAIANAIKSLKVTASAYPKLHSHLFEIEDKSEPESIFGKYPFELQMQEYERSAPYRYKLFLQMRVDIKDIAKVCMGYRQKGRFVDHELIAERLGFKNRNKGYSSYLLIRNGKVDFESVLIQVLRGVDAKRLRICPICNQVFWAKRIETSTCQNKRCSNQFHQRKLRIAGFERRLDKAREVLKKRNDNLSPNNSLIKEADQEVNKLWEKIIKEKKKNGTL